MIVEHGGNTRDFSLARGLIPDEALDLSASLHPCAPNIADVLSENLGSVRNYPDPRLATRYLAEAIGVDPERLLLTNGGSEAIALVADVLGEGNIVAPEFSLYQRHLKRTAETAPRWRSNPNNPLGTLADPAEQATVWDEAFYPIATGQFTRGDEQSWRIGSMTKIWACAGLRLGYVVAPDAQSCQVLASRQPKWSVNGLALAIIEPMLEKTDLRVMKDQLEVLRASLFLLLQEKGIANAKVKHILSPAWTTDWISEEGRQKLRLYGIAPPVNEPDKSALFSEPPRVACPKCNSEDTRMVSLFGSTACKAQYQCNQCLEPFDYFKCLK